MARTTSTLVRAILDTGGDYDTQELPSLTPFIDTASAIVDRVEACAIAKGLTLSSTELELIERWLSAHCYGQSDQPYSSRSTAGASGSFQGQTAMRFEGTKYGQMALSLDYSGCLDAIGKRQFASAFWLGKRPSAQTDYVQRD